MTPTTSLTLARHPRVAVAGPGRMGSLIALAYAFAGLDVDLVDVRARDADEAAARRNASFAAIETALAFLVDEGVADAAARDATRARIGWRDAAGAGEAFAAADLVIEAVAENAAEKAVVFAGIDRAARGDCVIGSTTSTISPDELAAMVSRPARYLNIHWINPAHLSPLVELQPAAATDPGLVAALRALHEAMGKVPIVCGPSPGYLMPRLQLALMNEAARMVQEGVAQPADIDLAMRWGLGVRYANMGLLEFVDWGGAEILRNAGRYLSGALQADRFAPPAIVDRMIAEGHTGLRSGQGFYDWRERDVAAEQRAAQHRILDLLRRNGRLPLAGALR